MLILNKVTIDMNFILTVIICTCVGFWVDSGLFLLWKELFIYDKNLQVNKNHASKQQSNQSNLMSDHQIKTYITLTLHLSVDFFCVLNDF